MTLRLREAGFSVIEALVALAVVAISLVSLIGLQTDVSRMFVRQREVRDELSIQRDALAVLRDVNLMERPRGAMDLGAGRSIRWQAAPASRLVRTTRQGSGDGDFEILLYRIDVEAAAAPGARALRISFEQVGWRRLEAVSDVRAAPIPQSR